MSERLVADVDGKVFAYRKGALLFVVMGEDASPFGPACEPVRQQLVGRCAGLVKREPNPYHEGDPEWSRRAELSIYKVWDTCPPYEHTCAELVADAVG